jgi:hypothetical protein
MIVSEIWTGSGLGNQIWHYVVPRVVAEHNGYEFGIEHPERWKARHFMQVDFGKEVVGGQSQECGGPPIKLPDGITSYYSELHTPHPVTGFDWMMADPHLFNIPDNTKIDGSMQHLTYIDPYREKILEWMKYDDNVKVLDYSSDDVCVIQFRGGDYLTGHSFCPPEYYQMAMVKMKELNPNMEFVIVTDDPTSASNWIPGVPIVGSAIMDEKDPYQGSIGWYRYPGGPIFVDYSILNTAKNVIISSSTFSFWPVWLNTEVKNVIAPMYWFDWQRSNGWWRPDDSIVDSWLWLDREGNLLDGVTCKIKNAEHKGVL